MAMLSADERLELGRMAINTLDEWGLKASDQANVLALPKGTPTRMLRRYVDDTPLPDDPDVLKHVEHLLGIADALRTYSDFYRTERQQKAEELAAKLPVKLIFPLMFFIFPSLMLAILGPALIAIYKSFGAAVGQ